MLTTAFSTSGTGEGCPCGASVHNHRLQLPWSPYQDVHMERHELREISIESCLLGQASRRPKPSSQAEDGDATAICQSADDKQNKTVADGSHAYQPEVICCTALKLGDLLRFTSLSKICHWLGPEMV